MSATSVSALAQTPDQTRWANDKCESNQKKHWICRGDIAWHQGFLVDLGNMERLLRAYEQNKILKQYKTEAENAAETISHYQASNRALRIKIASLSDRGQGHWYTVAGVVVGLLIGAGGGVIAGALLL